MTRQIRSRVGVFCRFTVKELHRFQVSSADIEKGGRRKEALFICPEIREQKQEEQPEKPPAVKESKRTVLQTAMAVLYCDKKQDCRKFKGSLQKKNIGCEGKNQG